MIEFLAKSGSFYSRKQVWFYDGISAVELANNTIFFQSKPLKGVPTVYNNKYETSVIDLSQSNEDIFQNIKRSTTKNEIRKAEKMGMTTVFYDQPSAEEVALYFETYQSFCEALGLVKTDRDTVQSIVDSNHFCIAHVLFEGQVISSHTYIFDEERFRLLNSYYSMEFQDLKERAFGNKLLHLNAIYYAKALGLKLYDLGGIDMENVPGISKFKLSFGGVPEYSNEYMVATGLYGLFYKFRSLFSK